MTQGDLLIMTILPLHACFEGGWLFVSELVADNSQTIKFCAGTLDDGWIACWSWALLMGTSLSLVRVTYVLAWLLLPCSITI